MTQQVWLLEEIDAGVIGVFQTVEDARLKRNELEEADTDCRQHFEISGPWGVWDRSHLLDQSGSEEK